MNIVFITTLRGNQILKEGHMENVTVSIEILYQVMSGLGIFFTGIGVLWFVSVYKEKKKK